MLEAANSSTISPTGVFKGTGVVDAGALDAGADDAGVVALGLLQGVIGFGCTSEGNEGKSSPELLVEVFCGVAAKLPLPRPRPLPLPGIFQLSVY